MRTLSLALTAAAVALCVPAVATAAPPSAMLTCKDGTIATGKARDRSCRGHGGVFAASASKTVSTAAGGVTATSLATKLPNSAPARTTAVIENNGETRSTTDVTQISTPGVPASGMKPSPTSFTVRCYDNKVLKVRTLKGACKTRGGMASSVATAVVRVPAGATKSVATKTATGMAVATTANPENAASATRVSQTTVYPQPAPKPRH